MKKMLKQPFHKVLFICIIIILQGNIQVYAQKYTIDVISLKNGDIYKGIIIEQQDPEILRIETLCQNVMNFKMEDILSVSSEKFKPWSAAMPNTFGPKGYLNITDFGMLIGTGNNSKNAIFSISSFNGYGFSSKYVIGAGAGIELFETLMLPLNIETRWVMTDSKFSPFLSVKAGYSFALEDPESYWGESYNSTGGYLCGTGLGVLIWTNNRNAFELNIQYRYQDIKTIRTYEWSGETTTLTTKYNRLELRFGFLFQ